MSKDEVPVIQLYEQASAAFNSGNKHEAMQRLNAILVKNPELHPAWNLRGIVLQGLGHPFDAVMNYDKAIQFAPEIAEHYTNRGAANHEQEAWDQALTDYERALCLKPNSHQTYTNIGNVHMRRGHSKAALRAYRKAVEIDPTYVDAHLGMAFCLLELGQFEEGWNEYEWRWKSDQMVPRGLKIPEWNGSPAASSDDILMLYAEQGNGDAIQFLRYAPIVKPIWGGKLALEVRQPLTRLAKSMTRDGVDEVVTLGEQPPEGITHIFPVQSLPRLLGTTVDTIPNKCPYLYVDNYRVNLWRDRLKQLPPGLRVGVCWSGQNRVLQPVASAIDLRRSTTLAAFAPLAKVEQVSWVSLQKGPTDIQVKTPPSGMTIGDWTDDFHDFYDTAALISCLDLVITVDTSIVHLAGALNVPTWMLNRFDGCWRWLGKRPDSPWYPSLRIFHQPTAGDWDSVMQEAAAALRKFVFDNISKLAA